MITMPQHEYSIGEVYYQYGYATVVDGGNPHLVVSSWRFDGIEKLTCNSKACDTPYHFLKFTRVTGESDAVNASPSQSLYVASVSQARLSMLTKHEFIASLIELDNDEVF